METKNPQPAVAVPGASSAVLETSTQASSDSLRSAPATIRSKAIEVQRLLYRVHALSDAMSRVLDDLSCEDSATRQALGHLDTFNSLISEQVAAALELSEAIEVADLRRERADG